MSGPTRDLANAVISNLKDQHDWTDLELIKGADQAQRPFLRGLPPRKLYMHPDDQIEALVQERATGQPISQEPEAEYVLPVHVIEQWTVAQFSEVFDQIEKPPGARGKRIVLATVHNDSTVVYYLMHEGLIKPRQN